VTEDTDKRLKWRMDCSKQSVLPTCNWRTTGYSTVFLSFQIRAVEFLIPRHIARKIEFTNMTKLLWNCKRCTSAS